jgi:hypothetical protein
LGVPFSTNLKANMPFIPFLGVTFAALGLLKLGALSVMVSVLSGVIGLLVLVILGLAALLGWRHIKKP